MTFNDAIQQLQNWVRSGEKRCVSTCTVYTVMRGLEDQRIFDALSHADMRTADGMPLVWLQKLNGHAHAERVYGPDIMLALCELSTQDKAISHYLLGGLPGIPEKLTQELASRFAGLDVKGAYSPPVVSDITEPDPDIVERLNASGASVVWVGLGSPKQDVWMRVYRPVLDAPLLIGVGAAFDFIAGEKSQAPVWMQKRGLEWLFRLMQEPGRLWKRYTLYNIRFVLTVALIYLRKVFRS